MNPDLNHEKDKNFADCMLCPRACHVDRTSGRTGYCGQTARLRIARAALHFWEEPCISGTGGSGTIFFSGCPLRCVYCQNRSIAIGQTGREITEERLYEIFYELKEQGAHNINLVTPTHFVPAIAKVIHKVKKEGFDIPFVYNTSAYETVETLKLMEGLADIYLPDYKYASKETGQRYSNAPDYAAVAKKAIAEMFRQVGKPVFDEASGLMKRGVLVRHLVLPKHLSESKQIITDLFKTYGDDIYISIMNQYTPQTPLDGFPELDRKLSEEEYDEVVEEAVRIGVENGFIQEGDTAEESFIPEFDYSGVEKIK